MDIPDNAILSARDVGSSVDAPGGWLDIIHDIRLDLSRTETLAIVGTSGFGKSTLLGPSPAWTAPERAFQALVQVGLGH